MRKALLVMALLAAAAACAPLGNDTQNPPILTRPDAVPYAAARSRCFEEGFGAPNGGPNATAGRQRAYENCLSELGWGNVR